MRTIRDCRVAVIGGAGFLGSHLTDHLIDDRNCDVTVIDNLVVGRREFVHAKARFVHHDICGSEARLKDLLGGINFVFILAAFPYIPDSFARPLHVFDVNATGCMKAINAAQEAGCEGILQMSSAEIYGSSIEGSLTEDSPVVPHSTYGCAKQAVDTFCQVAWKERQTRVISLRQFNCVGERDILHPYIVPEVYRQLIREWAEFDPEPLLNRGPQSGVGFSPSIRLGNNSFRDFLYSGDAVRMAVELLEKGEFGAVYNSGSQDGVKIYTLAGLIARLMGVENVEIIPEPARMRPWEIWRLNSDNSKLFGTIDYRPKVNLKEALSRTIGWYRDHVTEWPW